MRSHTSRLISAITVAVTAVSLLAACGNPAERRASSERLPAGKTCPTAKTTGSIQIGMSAPLTVFAPLTLADQTGAFKKAGLDVTVEQIPTADSLPLVAQGKLDAQATSYSTAHYNVVNSGVDLRFVHPFDNQVKEPPGTAVPGYWARKDVVGSADNPDFRALRGKKVSTPTGGTGASAKILGDKLAGVGLSLSDVQMSIQVGPDALAALENGAVSAAWISAPLEIEAAKNSDLVPVAGYAPGVTGTTLLAGPKFVDRPEVLVRYLQVLSEVTEKYLQGDYRKNAETVSLLSEASGVKEDVIRKSALLRFDSTFSMKGVEDYLGKLQTFLSKSNELDYKKPLATSELVDTTFTEALATCAPPSK
ncbi:MULTISPECIES: ABC transporter substrate-binding protein [Streptomyces]|uniref:ABC transporter substrate-binding protein n=1 Tax=Streptomyces doudnae TaxID=3075536 RepID=A0ABD5EV84_9ACTN|nr:MULTISPECIES: ABC transporter substrate-binding protein [unclassified Streptomyces]MDT0438647.1 ABC transporter substrate-binding protein [Streptomyces sp. DSM 41981]MYQ69073.1 ABC transporter substrate-binding protein [Streptomyces sp. SID4950]SCE51162.1 ABC-type nitrate/sulfonate/bicarbonate transport system, substrate-binding protein [Streptomyces sp. SolWspMP-5a-2]